MLKAKRITRNDFPQLKEAARIFAEENGKGLVRTSMRQFAKNSVYGFFEDDELVGWRVISKEGRTLSEMGSITLEEANYALYELFESKAAARKMENAVPGAIYTTLDNYDVSSAPSPILVDIVQSRAKSEQTGMGVIGGFSRSGQTPDGYPVVDESGVPLSEEQLAELAAQEKQEAIEAQAREALKEDDLFSELSSMGLGVDIDSVIASANSSSPMNEVDLSDFELGNVSLGDDAYGYDDVSERLSVAKEISATTSASPTPIYEIDDAFEFDDELEEYGEENDDSESFGEQLLKNVTDTVNDPFFEGRNVPRTSKAKAAFVLADDPFKDVELPYPNMNLESENQLGGDGVLDGVANGFASHNASEFDDEEYISNTTDPKKPKLSKGKRIFAIIMTVLVLIGAVFTGYTAFKQLTGQEQEDQATTSMPEPDYDSYTQVDDDKLVHVQITSGMSPYDIRQALLDAGLVSCARDFMSAVDEQDAYTSLNAGEYIISGHESAESVVTRMIEGKRVPDGVIGVNNGDTIYSIAQTIDKANLPYSGDDFLAVARDVNRFREAYPMLADTPADLPSLEGYLATEEYDLSQTTDAVQAVEMMLAPMQRKFDEFGMSSGEFHSLLTKASLIEKEALFDEDRPLIASVINNRLDAGTFLQIDAAVKYANNSDEARVLDADLEVESPYNTYQIQGLPIGPICSGLADIDIDAARNPAQTEFFYYVLKDKEGHHQFCVTPEEFAIAKQQYLELFGYANEE